MCAYLLDSVDSVHQFLSRHTASNDLQRNPIFSDKEAGGYAYHWIFTQGVLRNKLPATDILYYRVLTHADHIHMEAHFHQLKKKKKTEMCPVKRSKTELSR